MKLPVLKTKVVSDGHPAGDDYSLLIIDEGGVAVAIIPERIDVPGDEYAAEIVRRCNAHDDLLAALARCEGRLSRHGDPDDSPAIEAARAALRVATGETA